MGESRIPEGKKRIAITLDDEIIDLVDHVAGQIDSNRSKVMGALIEMGLEEIGFAAVIGLTPMRTRRLRKKLEALGLMEPAESDRYKRAREKEIERIQKRLGYKPRKENDE